MFEQRGCGHATIEAITARSGAKTTIYRSWPRRRSGRRPGRDGNHARASAPRGRPDPRDGRRASRHRRRHQRPAGSSADLAARGRAGRAAGSFGPDRAALWSAFAGVSEQHQPGAGRRNLAPGRATPCRDRSPGGTALLPHVRAARAGDRHLREAGVAVRGRGPAPTSDRDQQTRAARASARRSPV